tara:strand:- start:2583 stop:2732 length:150 start_codon:yes stop_codon:yes gene_type:complete
VNHYERVSLLLGNKPRMTDAEFGDAVRAPALFLLSVLFVGLLVAFSGHP